MFLDSMALVPPLTTDSLGISGMKFVIASLEYNYLRVHQDCNRAYD